MAKAIIPGKTTITGNKTLETDGYRHSNECRRVPSLTYSYEKNKQTQYKIQNTKYKLQKKYNSR